MIDTGDLATCRRDIGLSDWPGVVTTMTRYRRQGMQEDSIFRIASQTKAIVSAATMILQEDGKLLIDDPIGKYLPEFRETSVAVPNENGGYEVVPARRPITVRDLLFLLAARQAQSAHDSLQKR